MRKIELKGRKLLRYLFGCVSFTAVAFVFQACYGVEPPSFYDVKLTGTVKSKTTNQPIKGIKVAVNNEERFGMGYTDENGMFDFYASVPNYADYDYRDSVPIFYTPDSVRVHFLDVDGTQNGLFNDTTIIINPAHKNEVKINVELEDKQ